MDIRIIYMALLHSLWLGILLSGLSALVIHWTREASALLRYYLLLACLALFVVATVVATGLYSGLGSDTALVTAQADPGRGDRLLAAFPKNPVAAIFHFLLYLNQYASAIVGLWMLVVVFKSFRLLAAWQKVQDLSRSRVTPAAPFWMSRTEQFAQKMGIRKAVLLLESARIALSMTIGYLKPVVLLPVGLLNGLSVQEVEAILCHELAHIKRKDYVINMLQCVVEIVFFFNPAVLWVSALIKTERENCCDDLTVSITANKKDYVKAMLSCAEQQGARPLLAAGLGGPANSLLNRCKRLLSGRNHTMNRKEQVVVMFLVLTLLFSIVFAGKDKFSFIPVPKAAQTAKWKAGTKENSAVPVGFPGRSDSAAAVCDAPNAKQVPAEPVADLILKQLRKDGLIGNTQAYSYKLDKDHLIVDGVEQPKDLLVRYKRKYLSHPGTTITVESTVD